MFTEIIFIFPYSTDLNDVFSYSTHTTRFPKDFRDIMEFVIGMQADGNLYKCMKLVSKGVVPLVNGLVCVAIVMNL